MIEGVEMYKKMMEMQYRMQKDGRYVDIQNKANNPALRERNDEKSKRAVEEVLKRLVK
jgi:hypothetical protein